MTLFIWKKSYEIGVAEIDMQHRSLVKIINNLSDAMMVKRGHLPVPQILEELSDYIQRHFAAEENLMRKVDYPALREHSQEHLDLTNQVLDLKENYLGDRKLGAGELLEFLCNWLRNHILISDKEIEKHIRRLEMGPG